MFVCQLSYWHRYLCDLRNSGCGRLWPAAEAWLNDCAYSGRHAGGPLGCPDHLPAVAMRLPVTERAIADVDAISACREIAMHDVSHDLPERTRARDGDVCLTRFWMHGTLDNCMRIQSRHV